MEQWASPPQHPAWRLPRTCRAHTLGGGCSLLMLQPGLAQAILFAEKAGPLLHPGWPVLMPFVLHMSPQRPLPFLCALNASVLYLYPAGDTLPINLWVCVRMVLLKQLRELTESVRPVWRLWLSYVSLETRLTGIVGRVFGK